MNVFLDNYYRAVYNRPYLLTTQNDIIESITGLKFHLRKRISPLRLSLVDAEIEPRPSPKSSSEEWLAYLKRKWKVQRQLRKRQINSVMKLQTNTKRIKRIPGKRRALKKPVHTPLVSTVRNQLVCNVKIDSEGSLLVSRFSFH